MDKFTTLIAELEKIGYEASNEDCMELEFNGGNGFVTFMTKDLITVRLPFDDWKLNMNYIGNSLSFQRCFEIKSPAFPFDYLEVEGAEREFDIKLNLITLPGQLMDTLKLAIQYLAPITVESII